MRAVTCVRVYTTGGDTHAAARHQQVGRHERTHTRRRWRPVRENRASLWLLVAGGGCGVRAGNNIIRVPAARRVSRVRVRARVCRCAAAALLYPVTC